MLLDETNTVSQEKINEIDELLQYAADYLKLPEDTEMSVTFMDNAAIQVINRDYRDKDQPTDVISFALEEETEEELPIIFDDEMPAMPRNLGDIMISVERAKEQLVSMDTAMIGNWAFSAAWIFAYQWL